VLFTKHLTQKSKVWDDGFLEYHIKPQKLILFASTARANLLDSKFYRSPPDLGPGEQLRLNKFIIEIDRRRLEGRSSVKRENKASASKNSHSSGTNTTLKMGTKSGSCSKSTLPLSASKPGGFIGFPKKGRKPFICPKKELIAPISEGSLEDDDEFTKQRFAPYEQKSQTPRTQNPKLDKASLMREQLFGGGQEEETQTAPFYNPFAAKKIEEKPSSAPKVAEEEEEDDILTMLRKRREE